MFNLPALNVPIVGCGVTSGKLAIDWLGNGLRVLFKISLLYRLYLLLKLISSVKIMFITLRRLILLSCRPYLHLLGLLLPTPNFFALKARVLLLPMILLLWLLMSVNECGFWIPGVLSRVYRLFRQMN
jgi:hypothetical protein